MGGGAATWIAKRRALGSEDSQVNVLSGMAGVYGGMLSSPVIVVMLLLEVARPGGNRFTKTLLGTIIASSVGFGIYFAIAGAVFLDIYKVPQYKFEDWQLLAGVRAGLVRGRGGDRTGPVHGTGGALVRPDSGHCAIHARRRAVRDRRRGATADALHRQRAAQDGAQRREHARRRPAGCHRDREDLHLRGEPGRADSSAGRYSRRCSSGEPQESSSTSSFRVCHSDWRSPACSPPSPGRSSPHRSRWCCSPRSYRRWAGSRPRRSSLRS